MDKETDENQFLQGLSNSGRICPFAPFATLRETDLREGI